MVPASALMAIDLIAALPARARERLAAVTRTVKLAAGENADALGEAGSILFIETGVLRISAGTHGTIAFSDLGAGAAAGLLEAVAGESAGPRAVLALEAATALVIPASTLPAAVQASAGASFVLARRFAAELSVPAADADPLQRIFRDLLQSARPLDEARWTIDPLPRHREIAERAGVAEADAATAIAHLVRLGVARRRYPALDIEDRDALRSLAG